MSRVPNIARSIQNLLPQKIPPSLVDNPASLYQVLSRNPHVVGREVHQTRWGAKQISDSYWVVTRARFKCEGKHGKAWGQLYWKGKLVSPKEELISGGLKYKWADGRSRAIQPAEPVKATA